MAEQSNTEVFTQYVSVATKAINYYLNDESANAVVTLADQIKIKKSSLKLSDNVKNDDSVSGVSALASSFTKVFEYREAGTTKWESANTSGDYSNYLFKNLKQETDYEIRWVWEENPDVVFWSSTIATGKGSTKLSVAATDVKYDSANININFNTSNYSSNTKAKVYWKSEAGTVWKCKKDRYGDDLVISARSSVQNVELSSLTPGTTYNVLVEVTTNPGAGRGKDVIRYQEIEFTTLDVTASLKMAATPGKGTADVELTLANGGNRNFKAGVWFVDSTGTAYTEYGENVATLDDIYGTQCSGASGYWTDNPDENDWKFVFFDAKNPKAIMNFRNLAAGTYTVKAYLFQSFGNTWADYLGKKEFTLGRVKVDAADAIEFETYVANVSATLLNASHATGKGYTTNAAATATLGYVASPDDTIPPSTISVDYTSTGQWDFADEASKELATLSGTASSTTVTPKAGAYGTAKFKATIEITDSSTTPATVTPVELEASIDIVDYDLMLVDGTNADGTDKYKDDLSGLATMKAGDKYKLVVRENKAPEEGAALAKSPVTSGVTWKTDSPSILKASDSGEIEAVRYGRATLAGTIGKLTFDLTYDKDDDGLEDSEKILVNNKLLGVKMTSLEGSAGNDGYIEGGVWNIVAGENYTVNGIESPAYTVGGDTKNTFTVGSATGTGADLVLTSETSGVISSDAKNINIPESMAGQEIEIAIKDKGTTGNEVTYKQSIKVKALKKPTATWTNPETYIWLEPSAKLSDAPKPEGWVLNETDRNIYSAGYAGNIKYVYVAEGYYKATAYVDVYALRVDSTNGNMTGDANATYRAPKTWYIEQDKTGTLTATTSISGLRWATGPQSGNLYKFAAVDSSITEVAAPSGNAYKITPTATSAKQININIPFEYYNVKFDAAGKASIDEATKKTINYPITICTGTKAIKDIIVDVPKGLDADSKATGFVIEPYNPTTPANDSGDVVYRIGSKDPAGNVLKGIAKETTVIVPIKAMSTAAKNATDWDVTKIENVTAVSSNAKIVKKAEVKDNTVVLTIAKGAEGLANVVLSSSDSYGYKTAFAVRIRNYKPQTIKTTAVTLNRASSFYYNDTYSNSTRIAQVHIPYEDVNSDSNDRNGENELKGVYIVKNNKDDETKALTDVVAYSSVHSGDDVAYSRDVYVSLVRGAEAVTKSGNYYLLVKTGGFADTYIKVKLNITNKKPTATVKQTQKVNVFFTDTTSKNWNNGVGDGVAMGAFKITPSKGDTIREVVWRPTAKASDEMSTKAANSQFVIMHQGPDVKNVATYSIRQNNPTLIGTGSKITAVDAAKKGTLYIYFNNYDEPVKKEVTIATVYKKPKLSIKGDYKFGVDVGDTENLNRVMFGGIYPARYKSAVGDYWNDAYTLCRYLRLTSSNPDASVEESRNYFDPPYYDSYVRITYNKNTKGTTQLTFFSDYWNEALSVNAKLNPVKTTFKLDRPTITLNAAYHVEEYNTGMEVDVISSKTRSLIDFNEINVEGKDAPAKALLEQKLINITKVGTNGVFVSVNNAAVMNGTIAPKAYVFNISGTTSTGIAVKPLKLTVKIINAQASVKVAAKGKIDLTKYNGTNPSGTKYMWNSAIFVKPTFKNISGNYEVTRVTLSGPDASLFNWGDVTNSTNNQCNGKGEFYIVRRSMTNALQAKKTYTVTVNYSLKDISGGNSKTPYTCSSTINITPVQSTPKITPKPGKVTIYASKVDEETGDQKNINADFRIYAPDYTEISGIVGTNADLDVDKDGRADIRVSQIGRDYNGNLNPQNDGIINSYRNIGTYRVTLVNPQAVQAKTYAIPVTVRMTGADGVAKDSTFKINVTIKK